MDDESPENLVQCPYCWALAELPVDPEDEGEMVVDCDVCCRPWKVTVSRDPDGRPRYVVERS